MKSSLFLTCLCIVFLAIPQFSEAQRISKKVPIIQEDDTVRVYSAFSRQFLKSERLVNQKSILLTKAEIKQFNQLFESTKQSHRQSYSPLTQEGIFIEVRPREGKKYGYYISPKKYAPISTTDYGSDGYKIPKKKRPQIKQLLEYYRQQLPDTLKFMQHNYQQANLTVTPLNKCTFNSMKKMVTLFFHTRVDSSTIVSIQYRVYKSKKWGITVWREIPLWEYMSYLDTDKEGNIRIYNDSKDTYTFTDQQYPESEEILWEIFPEWKNMSNSERMKMLDDYFERYATLIRNNKKERII